MGGVMSLLFGASLIVFVTYAMTTYVKNNAIITKAPTTEQIAQLPISSFEVELEIKLHGSFEDNSTVNAYVTGMVPKMGDAGTAEVAVVGNRNERTLKWSCSSCKFEGFGLLMPIVLGSKREFLHTVEWKVTAASWSESERAEAWGVIKVASPDHIFAKRSATSTIPPRCTGIAPFVASDPAIAIEIEAVPVHYLKDERRTVRRAKVERVGLELSYVAHRTAGETCEFDYWDTVEGANEDVGLQVQFSMSLASLGWRVHVEQKSSAFFLAIELSAIIGGIQIIYVTVLMILQRFKGPLKHRARAIVRRVKSGNGDDAVAIAAGDDANTSSSSSEEDEEQGERRPLIRELLQLHSAVRELDTHMHTLYHGGEAKPRRIRDLVAKVWQIETIVVAATGDELAVLSGDYVRAKGHLEHRRFPTWKKQVARGSDGANERKFRIYAKDNQWCVGRPRVEPKVKSISSVAEASPLEAMWESAPEGVALSESAFSASTRRSGWLVNLAKGRKSVGVFSKVNPMRRATELSSSSSSSSSSDSDGSDSANEDAPGEDAPGEDAPGEDAPGEDAPSEDTHDDALPEGWTKHAAECGNEYFTNDHHPQESTWTKPTLPACPPGYVAELDVSTGKVYFLHVAGGTSSWHHPAKTPMDQIDASGSV